MKKIILIIALSICLPCYAHGALEFDFKTDIVEKRLEADFGKRNSVKDYLFYLVKNGANVALAICIAYLLANLQEDKSQFMGEL